MVSHSSILCTLVMENDKEVTDKLLKFLGSSATTDTCCIVLYLNFYPVSPEPLMKQRPDFGTLSDVD